MGERGDASPRERRSSKTCIVVSFLLQVGLRRVSFIAGVHVVCCALCAPCCDGRVFGAQRGESRNQGGIKCAIRRAGIIDSEGTHR